MKNDTEGKKIFITLAIFFGVIFLANGTLIYLAASSDDGMVDSNYYSKGLNYQSTLNERLRQKAMDWTVDFKRDKSGEYRLKVIDRESKPIEEAKVNLIFFRPTQSGYDQNLSLKEEKPGFYSGKIELPLKGIWDVNIEIKKENKKWKKKQRIVLD